MELNYAGLFSNKLVEPGEYMAKVISVEAVPTSEGGNALSIEVEIDNNESQYDGTRLVAVLHRTPKGQKFIDLFLESYRVDKTSLQQAVGRWAAVYIYESMYKGCAFGVVKFHRQPAAAKTKAAELEALTPDPNVPPEPSAAADANECNEDLVVLSADHLDS